MITWIYFPLPTNVWYKHHKPLFIFISIFFKFPGSPTLKNNHESLFSRTDVASLLWLLKMTFVKLAEPTGAPVNSQLPAWLLGSSSHQVSVRLLGFANLKLKWVSSVACYGESEVYNFHNKTNKTSWSIFLRGFLGHSYLKRIPLKRGPIWI